MIRLASALLPLLLAACYPWSPPALSPVTRSAGAATGQLPVAATTAARAPVTILVSIDGFRPDYLQRGVTPALNALAARGVTATMRSAFPTKTAPNHWTLVTGLRPDRNGITANNMADARLPGTVFTIDSDDPFWWSEGEPIWVSAEKAGIRTATLYWPGSSAAVGGVRDPEWPYATAGGVRPSDWHRYYFHLPEANRVDTVIDWLRRPDATRPRFVALYLDSIDTAGHSYGPDAAETTAAVGRVDAVIARLVAGLDMLGQPANLIIVSDHGMTAVSRDRLVAFDDLLGPGSYRLLDAGAFATVVPGPGQSERIVAALTRPRGGAWPHMTCWTPSQVPARYHYGRNPRVAPVTCMAARGWQIRENRAAAKRDGGGDHGFDPYDPEMKALFLASGPAFRAGRRLPEFENVAVAPLLRRLLGLSADRTLDGNYRPFRDALTR